MKPNSLRELWPLARKVRWIHSLSAGVEKMLFPELAESPVPMTNAKGVFKRSLAEFAVLGMLYFSKRVPLLLAQQRECRWEQFYVTGCPNAECRLSATEKSGESARFCEELAGYENSGNSAAGGASGERSDCGQGLRDLRAPPDARQIGFCDRSGAAHAGNASYALQMPNFKR